MFCAFIWSSTMVANTALLKNVMYLPVKLLQLWHPRQAKKQGHNESMGRTLCRSWFRRDWAAL